MARSAGIAVDNQLIGGLITEATGLNFPENAATDISNLVIDDTGLITRRLGFDFEGGYSSKEIDKTNKAINYFIWKNAGNNGNRSFVTIQVGLEIHFYEVGTAEGSLSEGAKTFSIDLNPYYIGGPDPQQIECSFASGLGYLFITHPNIDPLYVSYDSDDDSFNVSVLTIEIRDFEGVVDGLDWDERPTTLTNPHRYNIMNQGWYHTALNAVGFPTQTISAWRSDGRTTRSDYPSNSDVWWYYKGPYPFYADDVLGANSEYFRNILVNTVAVGNSPAPKGHYILNLHYQDRSAASGVPDIPVQTTALSRVSCNAFFAGRVFYSGLSGEGYVGKVYFSQVIERNEQFGACYQQMDPTAESNSDLLPTDGGVIAIADCGTILRMQAVGNSLIVWANNGIWSISGSEGIGFRANDYAVTKISSTTILNASNFIDVEGLPMWWNQNGIYSLIAVDQAGSFNVQNVSDKQIKTFLNDIPADSKKYVRGYYNNFTKTINWLYRTSAPTTVEQRYQYNAVLVHDLKINAFYPWTLPSSDITFHGVLVVDGSVYQLGSEVVVAGDGLPILTILDEEVTVTRETSTTSVGVFKYIVYQNGRMTFAETRNINHIDWAGVHNLSYTSYADFGWKVHGEGMRKFQATYVTFFIDTDLPSSMDVYTKWDWATSNITGRYSSVQRLTVSNVNYKLQKFRRKIRGHGVALQFRIQSVGNEPMSYIGLSMYETGNQSP